MNRLKESLRRPLQRDTQEPGLLDLHLAIIPLALTLLSKIVVKIPRKLSVSEIRSFASNFGEMPSFEEDAEAYYLIVPTGSTVGVKIGAQEYLFSDTRKRKDRPGKGRVIHGGKIRVREDGSCFMHRGIMKPFYARKKTVRLDRDISARYEPEE